ncbi:MAG: ABC transporter ATP-binding protein [Candidatus Heimdallarchaeota archaeon]
MKIWRLAGKLMRFRTGLVLLTLFFTIAWLGGRFAISFAVQEIIDTLTDYETLFSLDITTLFIIAPFTYLVTFIFGAIFDIVNWLYWISCEVLVRKNMMLGLLKKPGAQALPDTTGEAISRFRGDVMNIVRLSYTLAIRIGIGLYSIGLMVYLFTISWEATSLIFAPFALILVIGLLGRKKMSSLRKVRRKAAGEVTGTLGKIFGSIQTFKVATVESNVLRHFDSKTEIRKQAVVKEEVFSAIINSIFLFSISMGMGVILLLIGPAMNLGNFTVGNLFFFQSQIWWLGEFVWLLGDMIPVVQQGKVSYNRTLRIIQNRDETVTADAIVADEPIYVKEDFPPFSAVERKEGDILSVLSAENLTYQYPGTDKGIANATLNIKRGSFTVITGRIGAGKTTLLRTILGLLPTDNGKIYWNGKLVDEPSEFMIPPRSAYTPQVPFLFSESLRNNILMNLREEEVNIAEAIRLAIIEKEVEEFDDKLDTRVGPKGVRLSGGQKQRLAAARMFVRDSELYVFDDLSSALDVETEQKLWEQLFAKGKEITCLVVSHRPLALRRADNIIILKKGQIIDQGKLDELLERSTEMQKLWEGDLSNGNSTEEGF